MPVVAKYPKSTCNGTGWFVGQDAEPVVRHVTADHHQDVDPVRGNPIRGRLVVEGTNIPVPVELGLEPFRDLIGKTDAAVPEDLESVPIPAVQKRLEVVDRGVVAELRAQIADPKTPVRIRDIGVISTGQMGRGVTLGPAEVLIQNPLRIEIGQVA